MNKVRFGVFELKPWTEVEKGLDGEIKLKGFLLPFFNFLVSSAKLGANLSLATTTGVPDNSGQWNGALGMVFRNEVDIILPSIFLNEQRFTVGNITPIVGMVPYTVLASTFTSGRPTSEFFSLKTVQVEVWVCMIVFSILLAIIYRLTHRVEIEIEKLKFKIIKKNSIGYLEMILTFLAFLILKVVPIKEFQIRASIGRRTIRFIWMFGSVLITAIICSSIISHLAKTSDDKVNSLTDILKYPNLKPVVRANNFISRIIKDSDNDNMRNLWKQIVRTGGAVPIKEFSTKPRIEDVLNFNAVLIERVPFLSEIMKNNCNADTQFYLAKKDFLHVLAAVVIRRGLPDVFKNDVCNRVLWYWQAGLMQRDWNGPPQPPSCVEWSDNSEKSKAISAQDLSICFRLWKSGVIASLLSLVMELQVSMYFRR